MSSERPRNARYVPSSGKRIFTDEDILEILGFEKREIVRYNIEVYRDQKESLQRVCDLYEQRTGKKLAAGTLLRSVLDSFLPHALEVLDTLP